MHLTGANFRANDTGIVATLDGVPITMTASGATVQETTTNYTTGVRANGSGEWTADITLPAGLPDGLHTLTFVAHDFVHNAISSLASTTFTGGLNTSSIVTQVTTTPPVAITRQQIFQYVLTMSMGIGPPDRQVLANNQVAYIVAYAIAQAVSQNVTLTIDVVKSAIIDAFNVTNLFTHAPNIGFWWGPALNLLTTNIIINVNILLELITNPIDFRPFARFYLNDLIEDILDPLAQTFTTNSNSYITSINLYPTIGSASPVLVSLTNTDNGLPEQAYSGTSSLPASSISTSGANNFAFDPPIYVPSGTEMSFIVATDDTACAVATAVIGQNDVETSTLVAQNPTIGTLLDSSTGESWDVINGEDIKFDINIANFTSVQGILNFGQIIFAQASSIITFTIPFVKPTANCDVQFQYSFDNTNWITFPPLAETDLGGAYDSIYLRVLLLGTASESPTVFGSAILKLLHLSESGAYVHRRLDMG